MCILMPLQCIFWVPITQNVPVKVGHVTQKMHPKRNAGALLMCLRHVFYSFQWGAAFMVQF